MISIFTLSTLLGCPHDKASITYIETQDGLKNLLTKSQGPIIISLYMQECKHCEKLEPIIDKLAADKRFNNLCFYRADAHNLKPTNNNSTIKTQDLIQQTTGQNIPGYPYLLFMNKGKFITKQVGLISENDLQKKIERTFSDFINNA